MPAPAGGDKNEDLKRIQGTWAVTPSTLDGVPDEKARAEGVKAVAGMRFTFRGGELRITSTREQAPDQSGPFRLNPTKTPKQIDSVGDMRVIYDLDGDTLKLCFDIRGKANGRPTKFKFDKDKPTVVYYILKRVKE